MNHRHVSLAMLLVVAIGATSLSVGQTSPFRQARAVALTGQVAPETGGKQITSVGHPSINSLGAVAFRSQLTASTSVYDSFVGKVTPTAILVVDAKGSLSRIVGYGIVILSRESLELKATHRHNDRAALLAAGATHVAATLIEARDQIVQAMHPHVRLQPDHS